MTTLLLLILIALVYTILLYLEEIHPKKQRSITQIAKRDLDSARRRGDIDKGGRCYHGERKLF